MKSLSCQHCGTECRPAARFCDQCGSSLAPAAGTAAARPRTELRQGTLMFCDLVNSTRLANELDPDDLRLVFAAFQRVAREALWHHGGHVVRWAGDGAFAVFGYPAAQEDSAESALRAALGLVRAIRNERLPRVQGLQLRVGVASGPVVMGEMIGGSVIGEQSVTGPVAHLAARLAASAAPDSVVLCDDTRRLAGQRFEFDALGELALKGFPAPVAAWRLVGEGRAVSRLDAQRGRGTLADLVGRAEVVQALLAQWAGCAQGQGGGVLLLGDAGIGKSRVARALQLELAPHDPTVLDLHFTPRTQGSPLHPVAVLLRRLADVQPGDDGAAMTDKVRLMLAAQLPRDDVDAALHDLLPLFAPQPAAEAGPDSPERVRQRMIDRLIAALLAMAARRPVFLLVEDLHWADPSTLALLAAVLDRADRSPLLMLATARSGELAAGLALPRTTTLTLGPLGAGEAGALVRQQAGGALDGAAIDTIVRRGEGNPLFLEELTRSALAGGAAADRLPGTLQLLVQARLDRFPLAKPIVQAASVLGREFRFPVLARLAADAAGLDAAMAALVDEGLLEPGGGAGGDALRFKHALIHDAIYQTLLRGERQRLHGRTAELLHGEFAGTADAAADQRAHHLAHGGRHADAIGALLEASRGTSARAAYQESIDHLQRGIALLPEIDDEARRRGLELQLKAQLGVPMTALLGYAVPAVEQLYNEAAELVDEHTPAVELFPILRGLSTYYFVRGQMTRADDLARQCLQLADRAGRAELRIDALSFAAYPAMYLGRIAEASRHAEAAVALYQSERGERFVYPVPQDPATAAWAVLSTTAWLGGDFVRADQAVDALLAHAERLDRPFDTAYANVWLAASCQLQRRFASALRYGQAGYALADRHGLGTWVPVAAMQLAIAGGALEPSPQAIGTLQQVHQAFLMAGAEASASFYGWGLAQAQLRAGDRAAARATLAAAFARNEPWRETYMRPELLILRAAAAERATDARADLETARAEARAQGALTVALRAAARLALLDGDEARTPLARSALAVIDSGNVAGVPRDWVATQLAALEPALAATSR